MIIELPILIDGNIRYNHEWWDYSDYIGDLESTDIFLVNYTFFEYIDEKQKILTTLLGDGKIQVYENNRIKKTSINLLNNPKIRIITEKDYSQTEIEDIIMKVFAENYIVSDDDVEFDVNCENYDGEYCEPALIDWSAFVPLNEDYIKIIKE